MSSVALQRDGDPLTDQIAIEKLLIKGKRKCWECGPRSLHFQESESQTTAWGRADRKGGPVQVCHLTSACGSGNVFPPQSKCNGYPAEVLQGQGTFWQFSLTCRKLPPLRTLLACASNISGEPNPQYPFQRSAAQKRGCTAIEVGGVLRYR